jgi:hypothetical protein
MLKWISVSICIFVLVAMLSPVFALAGDTNGDGVVDVRDVAAVASSYGSYPGHPRWNPTADLNNDLKIDVKDVALVASNFGKRA